MKTCCTCKETKPLTEFFKDKTNTVDGHAWNCKVCKTKVTQRCRANNRENYNAYMRKYNKIAPGRLQRVEADKRRGLMRRYGLTVEDYDNLLASQGGHCAICPATKSLHVDHCHTSGKVRGILCASHNRSMAALDDLELFKALSAYKAKAP